MKKRFLQICILIVAILLPVYVLSDTQTQPAAAKEKSNDVKPTQTAKAPQSQPADDDVPVMIEVKPESKNTTTIATPPGLLESSIRRHNIYTRISKQAKDAAAGARTSEEQAEAKKMDAENQPPEEKKPPEQKKPPKN